VQDFNGRADDDKEQTGRPGKSTTDNNVCHANARIKQHECYDDINRQLDISLDSVHSRAYSERCYEKRACSLGVEDRTLDHSSSCGNLSPCI
jgi:hypothetical protein